MGRIAAPFGVKGWVKVQPLTAATQNLLAYKSWWVGREDGWREIAVAEARVQGRTVVARLEGCDDRDAAAAFGENQWRCRERRCPRRRAANITGPI